MQQPSITFRPLTREDFSLVRSWLAAPHVACWWNESNDPESVAAKYGPRVDGAEPTHVFIVEAAGRAIGWIQWYLWANYPEHAQKLAASDTSAGIDLAIGELGSVGVGLGPLIIEGFLRDVVFAHPSVSAVVTDPDERNVRSLRAFTKAGFSVGEPAQLPGDNCRRCVVRLDRPDGLQRAR